MVCNPINKSDDDPNILFPTATNSSIVWKVNEITGKKKQIPHFFGTLEFWDRTTQNPLPGTLRGSYNKTNIYDWTANVITVLTQCATSSGVVYHSPGLGVLNVSVYTPSVVLFLKYNTEPRRERQSRAGIPV